jgi:hypothetical protein
VGRRSLVISHCVSQDLANLLLGAAAVVSSAPLQLCLDVVIELSDQYLSHDHTIA